jgi:heme/copper-type cytochrome/quinol oxidase subunit 4
MSNYDFTDCKCSSYVYQPKDSLLSSFQDEAHHGTSYHSKCSIFILSLFLTIAYHISFSSSLFKSPATFICSMVFHLFTFRVYLTFEKAVTLILKHATFLRNSNLPESALTYAELDYQKANIDVIIQQHLITHGPEHSDEQFASFIMSIDIGLCILPFVTPISYHHFSASIKWLKHFLKAEAKFHEVSFIY